jgi:transposase InsO family protein
MRAVAWFNSQGISCRRVLSDNGSAYRSKPWRQACEAIGLTPKRTRPYKPRINGKAERFIKTLLAEWAYGMSFQSSDERNRLLGRYLGIYNRRRCHMALAGDFQESCHSLAAAQAACINGSCRGPLSSSGGGLIQTTSG